MSTATNRRQDIALEQTSGNFALIDTLRKWGITFMPCSETSCRGDSPIDNVELSAIT